ncbi:MAG: PIG-L family deacetylase [Anaerolineae bacterium]|nr:PIG-L family deacetylase [Anaerolineae bacterium]
MNILAYYAHPDDETMLMGGTLALLIELGARVTHLCATRGEGGERGDPPICRQAELGRVRTSELECAVRALGGGELRFLGYIDPLVGEGEALYPFTQDFERLVTEVRQTIHQVKPDAVITHGSNGEYGHPAHLLCHRSALAAVAGMPTAAPLLYTCQAAFPDHPKPRLQNDDDPAHLILDVTSMLPQKSAAALCHRSQHALFVRRASEAAGRALTVPEVMLGTESLRRRLPEITSPPDDALARLLLASGHARVNLP